MVIYMDILILENFIVNKFLLYITAQTIRIKISQIYITLAALIGSMYMLVVFYDTKKYFTSIYFKIFLAIVMIWIAFRKKNILFNLKAGIIFIIYSMMLAGVCIFIQISQNKAMIQDSMVIYNFSYKKLMLCLMLIYLFVNRILLFINDRKSTEYFLYDIEIILKGCDKKVKAFLDTGNELVEPVTNLPVIVVEKELFKECDIKGYNNFYIPYKVVDGTNGKLRAIKPECIKIYKKKENVEEKDALIAFCDEKLSSTGEYKALLSRLVL